MVTATVKKITETKNKLRYVVTVGLAELGTLYFPRDTKLPDSWEIPIPIEE